MESIFSQRGFERQIKIIIQNLSHFPHELSGSGHGYNSL